MVGCQINDKVDMDSAAWAARDGREIWRVAYRSTCKGGRLESSGSPPPEFESIRSAALREQEEAGGDGAGVAYLFDVPLDVARAACGYRMDVDPYSFVRLERSRSAAAPPRQPAPGWLARLFGGGKGRA